MFVVNVIVVGKVKKFIFVDKGNNIIIDVFYEFYIWYIIVLVDNGSIFWYC